MPCAFKAALTGSVLSAALADCDSASMMGAGVPAGAKKPIQMPASKPGMPCSSIVGTSGMIAARLGCAMPSALRLPFSTCGASVAATLNIKLMRPARRSTTA